MVRPGEGDDKISRLLAVLKNHIRFEKNTPSKVIKNRGEIIYKLQYKCKFTNEK